MGSASSIADIGQDQKASTEKKYLIRINDDTEISQNVNGVARKFNEADLKKNMQVLVYTEGINVVINTEFTAALIQPFIELTPLASPPASISP